MKRIIDTEGEWIKRPSNMVLYSRGFGRRKYKHDTGGDYSKCWNKPRAQVEPEKRYVRPYIWVIIGFLACLYGCNAGNENRIRSLENHNAFVAQLIHNQECRENLPWARDCK